MKMIVPAMLLALLPVPVSGAAAAVEPAAGEPGGGMQRGDQAAAFQARKEGRILPLDQILRRVSAQLPGWTYSGFDFEADSGGRAVYKLVYMRNGNVTWIYVDGRTGNTLGRK